MKKSILGVAAGILLGVVLIIGLVWFINTRPNKEEVLAQNPDSSETQMMSEEVSELLTEESELTEIQVVESEENTEMSESEEVIESETESELEQIVVSNPNAPYYIRINRLANCVTVYAKDAQGNYTVPVKAMICSVGLTDETPLGVYSIYQRYKWRLLFGGTYGQYAIRFKGHYLFHSVPYTRESKSALKEGQYNMLGEPASQGCVRLTTADAKWIYDNCIDGTLVEVYENPNPGPLGKPTSYKIDENSPLRGWDPTDPDPANPWKLGSVTITGVKDVTVKVGEKVDLMAEVKGTDVDGLPLDVTMSGVVDWSKEGTYTVTYSTTGILGKTAMATATVTVGMIQPPVESEVPVQPEKPVEPEIPTESETPTESEVQTESEIPAESEVSTESELIKESEVTENSMTTEREENTEEILMN